MDAVIFGFISIVLTAITLYSDNKGTSVSEELISAEDVTRSTKLNESFYEDPNAFTDISSALGFPKKL